LQEEEEEAPAAAEENDGEEDGGEEEDGWMNEKIGEVGRMSEQHIDRSVCKALTV